MTTPELTEATTFLRDELAAVACSSAAFEARLLMDQAETARLSALDHAKNCAEQDACCDDTRAEYDMAFDDALTALEQLAYSREVSAPFAAVGILAGPGSSPTHALALRTSLGTEQAWPLLVQGDAPLTDVLLDPLASIEAVIQTATHLIDLRAQLRAL